MSRPLIPRMPQGSSGLEMPQISQRIRKISTACGACKQRKTRCSGGNPCDACATRSSHCIYDATSDQRRKIANQRNMHDLAETQANLEKHQQLLGGIIATVRAGDVSTNEDLIFMIRSGVDLSQLAAHVRNECRSNLEILQAFNSINFVIDGGDDLPSPTQIFRRGEGLSKETPMADSQGSDFAEAHFGTDFHFYGVDGERHDGV